LNQRALPVCTVIVPCYNEGARLQSDQFHHFLEGHREIRILFVNDGSTDRTLAVLGEARRGFEDLIEILDKQPNGGKAEAVRLGMLAAIDSGVSYVGFWDADLATPLEAIPEFLTLLESNHQLQMVFGSRVRLLGRQVHRRALRHYPGRVFASVVSLILRLPIYDTQCGAKIFRVNSELRSVLVDPFLSRWVFDVEILARFIAMNHGDPSDLRDSIYEVPLMRWEDVAGSKLHSGDFLKASLDLLRIYRRYLAGGTAYRSGVTGAASAELDAAGRRALP
jgi:glycosyltransferase involved in cell wall biosynthesis